MCASRSILGLSIVSSVMVIYVGRMQMIARETKYILTLVILFKMNVLLMIYTLNQ